jgi:phosphoglycolate phosphatase
MQSAVSNRTGGCGGLPSGARADSQRDMATLTIVFDLDGTLVDTAPDLIDSLNVLFAREGMSAVRPEEARNLIGGGVRQLIERGLSLQGRARTPADTDRLFKDYVTYYGQHIADRSRPFPGVASALERLSDHQLAVCTNKLEWLSVRLLKSLDLAARFAVICGQDTFGIQKPDPEILRRTIEAAGGQISAAVMVGDSVTDIVTARAAGVPIIAVDFGYTEIPMTELKPDRVIEHFDALPAAISDLFPGSV